MDELESAIAGANLARYTPGQVKGHYESYFLRANHPKRPLAFWIRYTIFTPDGAPDKALGEIWGMYFNGETGQHVAVKDEHQLSQCSFSKDEFLVTMPGAKLNAEKLRGRATAGANIIEWNLGYTGSEPPLFLLPLKLYKGGFPKAKALVGRPFASFSGILAVNGKEIAVKDWIGSQNHNWGSKHTDLYAWGQVAGFDNAPRSFLEIGTARLKFGPVWTPKITVMVLRHEGKTYALNSIWQGLSANGSFDYFTWNFSSKTRDVEITGIIKAEAKDFVGLNYYNPPGGVKNCLNSKIASCRLWLTKKGRTEPEELATANRAAFEILTDDRNHGIPIAV